jgi:aspartyl-tRNA(Asn)/glutamyl-tRNA(Gln) amidotransferase subunit C
MALDPDAVRRIAQLARIAVSDREVDALQGELNGILGLIERMQGVDTRGVEPMAHAIDMHATLRVDAVTETDRRAEYQAGAPAVEDGLFLVPRVIE